jgi:DNA-binding response OmpR family regulator
MRKLKILWVEDDGTYPASVHLRTKRELTLLKIELDDPIILTSGHYVWETVRDEKPDIILIDHNLEDVMINGANIIIEIRFHNNETPIIYYSSEMSTTLMKLVDDEYKVHTALRQDLESDIVRIITEEFTT